MESPSVRVSFTIGGHSVELSRSMVESALENVEPEPLRTHAVVVRGTSYPVKQALREATGLDPLDFNTSEARRVLNRLGFELVRVTGSRS